MYTILSLFNKNISKYKLTSSHKKYTLVRGLNVAELHGLEMYFVYLYYNINKVIFACVIKVISRIIS